MAEPTLTASKTDDTDGDIRWTDDKIRWEDTGNKDNEDDVEDEERCAYIDPFKDQDPFDVFSFRYRTNPNDATTDTTSTTTKSNSQDNDESSEWTEISVRGYKTDSDEVWQSTGLTLWRASTYLCEHMTQHAALFHDKRILELGAGLGMCGILAHRLGRNSNVCITDGDTDALVHLRENVKRNRVTATNSDNHQPVDTRIVTAAQLLWGRDTTQTFMRKAEEQQQVLQQQHHDGQIETLASAATFDVLIASDIIYALVIVEPLWETVQLLLRRHEEAVFVMAYAQRDVPVTIDMVLKAAEEAGFSNELVDENPEGNIWVYNFRWMKEHLVE